MKVRWLGSARADLLRIIRFVSVENPIAARKIAAELVLAGDSLGTFPRRGRPGMIAETRELVVVRPYVIVYQFSPAGDVEILRIWHSAQNRT